MQPLYFGFVLLSKITQPMRILLALLLTACTLSIATAQRAIRGNGDVTTETRSIKDFTEISACCSFDVELREGPFEVRVEAESNLMDYIKTEVRSGTLELGFENPNGRWVNINNREPIRVYLTLPRLEGIAASSSSSVVGKSNFSGEKLHLDVNSSGKVELNFTGTEIDTEASSSGKITLRGSTDRLTIDASSAGKIDADACPAKRVRAEASSGSSVDLTVSEELEADASSGASIDYTGNPSRRDTDASSGGRVRGRN